MIAVRPILLLWSVWLVHSQNLIKNLKDVSLEGRLLISEVNPDNPGHDTAEFIELRHTSGQNVSLDGYTLVCYNGKTNTAYKVLNLTGFSTDKKGFFLIGSSAVKPTPSIILPHNTIQNGPDAIALYFGKGYKDSIPVTSDGLVDALVHKSKNTDQADVLVRTLTPGMEAFLEDASFHTADESIGRCLDIDGKWTFHMTHLSPGSENHCKGFPFMINEVSSPYAEELYVEIRGPPSTSLPGLSLAFISGIDQQVYYSTDVRGQTDASGLFLLVNEKHDNRAQQTLPNDARLLQKGGGAVALYLGKSSDTVQKTRYTANGLVNALVYGDYEDMDSHPLQDLTTGNNIIYWHTWDVNISASLCSPGEGNAPLFILGRSTPGQANGCPVITYQNITLCFNIDTDCSMWQGDDILTELLAALVQSLQTLCRCSVSSSMFTEASLTCQSRLLTLHAKQNATLSPQGVDHDDIQQLVTTGSTLSIRSKTATVTACSQSPTSPPPSPESSTDAPPVFNPRLLLINEVNPNTPGSAEDTEYVELYHTSNSSMSLAGYWVVLYNGKNNLAYTVLNLKGYYTDKNGYFLIGSNKMTPKPQILLRANTIQNGADAIALYYRPVKFAYTPNMPLTVDGLVDAVVYVSQAGDDASDLLNVLTPGQEAVHEDEKFFVEDESLSRCHGLVPFDHSSYQITKITPLSKNDCEAVPATTSGKSKTSGPVTPATPIIPFISEVGVMPGQTPYSFIELKGPPGGQIQDYTLVMYNREGKVYELIGLHGVFRDNGFYLISTNGTGDQLLHGFSRPYTLSPEALALYRGRPEAFPVGFPLTRKNLVDALVYTWEHSKPLAELAELSGNTVSLNGEHQLESVSRCTLYYDNSSSVLMTVPLPTPGTENYCHSDVTLIHFGLCMKDSSFDCSEWTTVKPSVLGRLKILLSRSIEHHCSCSSPPASIQELNADCMQDWLSVSGSVLTSHEDEFHVHNWNSDLLYQSLTLHDKTLGTLTGCLRPEKKRGPLKTTPAWR
ncbi:uncharacterized protein [Hyperolius riggenbachi]|uniref:uncharacterized protein isoform X2 n=1 Tax=Hyperolius riggenbachi TaxID=752182 RepID=UPI0035A35C27